MPGLHGSMVPPLLDTDALREALRIEEEACGLRVEIAVRTQDALHFARNARAELSRMLPSTRRPHRSDALLSRAIADWERDGGTTE